MIGIRADGNAKIGTGHLMRCIAVAKQLQALGEKPLFFTIDGMDLLAQAGFASVPLPGRYDDLSHEEIGSFLRARGVDCVLVDTYYADRAYFERIGRGIRTAYLFDMGDDGVPCDLLVSYNIYADAYRYPGAQKKLLGTRYVPLREEFRQLVCSRTFERASSLLLTTGGTDSFNISARLIERIRNTPELQDLHVYAVIGAMNRNASSIKQAAAAFGNVTCCERVENMSALMCGCDLAVSAGGTTLYEISACGLPCVTFSIADNQDELIGAMREKGIMLSAGIFREGEERCLRIAVDRLKELVADSALQKRLSERERKLVDGEGARRIASELIRLHGAAAR